MNQVIKKTFIATVAASVLTAASASAISQSQLDFFAENNIYFYDPESSSVVSYTDSLEGTILYNLIKDGYTEVAAAGIYSNLLYAGLRSSQLFAHGDSMDSTSDIDTYANGVLITEAHVHNLDDATIDHPFGLFQVNYGDRVNLLKSLDAANFGNYARAFDGNVYTNDNKTYNELRNELGKEVVSQIVAIELNNYMSGKSSLVVTQEIINAQNLSNISEGTNLKDALNKLETPTQAAELFHEVAVPELPGDPSSRATQAEAAYKTLTTTTFSGAGGAKLAEAAIRMSWPDKNHYFQVKQEYNDALNVLSGGFRTNCQNKDDWKGNGLANASRLDYAQDCGVFVATVILYTGVDPDFPRSGTQNHYEYMVKSSKWAEIPNNRNTNNLEPGDVFVYNTYNTVADTGGHIYMYVGDGNIASASMCNRTANITTIGWEGYSEKHSGVDFPYHIFRYVGN